jgi:hypothetical protein
MSQYLQASLGYRALWVRGRNSPSREADWSARIASARSDSARRVSSAENTTGTTSKSSVFSRGLTKRYSETTSVAPWTRAARA